MSLEHFANLVKIVLKRCPRTEKAVEELLVRNGIHPLCSVCCSSVEKYNGGGDTRKMSPVQVDLFKNLILALTLEASEGGGGSRGDCLTIMDQGEDGQNFGCSECLAKFVMLESLRKEISLLEIKVEEILSQLRKTIKSHRGLGSLPNLAVEPVLDMMTDNQSTLSDTEADNYVDKEIDLKPGVLLHIQDEVYQLHDVGGDTLGGGDLISEEQLTSPPVDRGGHTQSSLNVNTPRRCKLRATKVISAILRNDDSDDDHGNDDYTPNNESDTDSGHTSEIELNAHTQKKRYKHTKEGIPSHPSPKAPTEDEKDGKTHGLGRKRGACETCHKTFSTRKGASAHTKRIHLQQRRHKCQKCGKGFFIPSLLKRHLNMRIPCTELLKKKKFICSICKVGCSSKDLLLRHTRTVHNGEKRIHCPQSESQYLPRKKSTKVVSAIHNVAGSIVKSCLCDRRGKGICAPSNDQPSPNTERRCKIRAAQAISAILRIRNGNDEHCPKNESDTDTNKLELDSITLKERDDKRPGISSDPLTELQEEYVKSICTVCGNQISVCHHMKTHRLDEKRFSCGTCHERFSTLDDVLEHRKRIHLQQRPQHKCEKCGKVFSTASEIKSHLNMRIPCTELLKKKQFICPICKTGCSSKDILLRHTRTAHNEEKRKNFYCPKCKGQFFSETNFQRHKLELCQPKARKLAAEFAIKNFPRPTKN